jgi:hypothetical protein
MRRVWLPKASDTTVTGEEGWTKHIGFCFLTRASTVRLIINERGSFQRE